IQANKYLDNKILGTRELPGGMLGNYMSLTYKQVCHKVKQDGNPISDSGIEPVL
ncbi:hypothetical protein Tco_1180603, partial [Tanacetum coccineum]